MDTVSGNTLPGAPTSTHYGYAVVAVDTVGTDLYKAYIHSIARLWRIPHPQMTIVTLHHRGFDVVPRVQ